MDVGHKSSHFSALTSHRPRTRRLRQLASRWLLAASLPVASAAAWAVPAVCRAQAADPAPEIENAKHSFEGVVIDRTFVRSGPSDTFYPTQNIEKGAAVIVVAKKGNWLKIQPPEGSFSYIQKAFVNKYGDGKNGKVTTPTLIVRAGSSVQPQLQWAVQTKLDVGQDVTILGEENEYFKIRPPESAYLYIKADEVKPVRVLPKSGERPADPPALTTADPTPPVAPPQTEVRATRPPRIQPQPQTLPSDTVAEELPTTGPSGLDTVTRLQKLEADFAAASSMPLTEQPIEALLAGYQGLASSPTVPEPTRSRPVPRLASNTSPSKRRGLSRHLSCRPRSPRRRKSNSTSRRSKSDYTPPSALSGPAACRLAMAR
jgi:uncharacterized protein YgiM (DUF1202 family)